MMRPTSVVGLAFLIVVWPAPGKSQTVSADAVFLHGLRTVAIDFVDPVGKVDPALKTRILQPAVRRLEEAGLRVVGTNAEQAPNSVLTLTVDMIPGQPPSVTGRLQLMTAVRSAPARSPDQLATWYCQESVNGDLLQEAAPLAGRLIGRFISAWQQANR